MNGVIIILYVLLLMLLATPVYVYLYIDRLFHKPNLRTYTGKKIPFNWKWKEGIWCCNLDKVSDPEIIKYMKGFHAFYKGLYNQQIGGDQKEVIEKYIKRK